MRKAYDPPAGCEWCPSCHGNGVIFTPDPDGGWTGYRLCTECDGYGWIDLGGHIVSSLDEEKEE